MKTFLGSDIMLVLDVQGDYVQCDRLTPYIRLGKLEMSF